MIDSRIKFDEKYVSDVYGTTTLYFIAPKEFLNNKYPDAESTEISVEFQQTIQNQHTHLLCFPPQKMEKIMTGTMLIYLMMILRN